mgnify:CR=1 FL=1
MGKYRNTYDGDSIEEVSKSRYVRYECDQCKSDDIVFNVQAKYDSVRQEFEVVQTEEPVNAERCNECGDEWEQLLVYRKDDGTDPSLMTS